MAETTNQIISTYLDTNGDGSGEKNAVDDYSANPTLFYLQPPPDYIFVLTNMTVAIVDTGSIDADRYGNNIELQNGIRVYVANDAGIIYRLHDKDHPIMTSADWRHAWNIGEPLDWGQGREHFTAEWDFRKALRVIKLDGNENERFVVELHDDFRGLVDHTFSVLGFNAGQA